MPEQLNVDGTPVQVGRVLISTPGLSGEVDVLVPGTGAMRAEQRTTPDFLLALSRTGLTEQLAVVIKDPREHDATGGTRAQGGGADIVVQVPGPGTGLAQVLLYTAEDGSQTWHLPDDVPADPDALAQRGGAVRTYRIPRAVVPAPETDAVATRGIVGAIGKKILTVLAFRLVEAVGEFVAEKVAERWEAVNRPYRVRTFTVEDHGSPTATTLEGDALEEMTAGQALLVVHGTFSLTHSGFGALPDDLVRDLHERYGGRVLGFDHPTLSVSPTENARWFAHYLERHLSGDRPLSVDVVAHSRGGLVARELATYAHRLPGRLTVDQVVMVGTPNAGTPLADAAHLMSYVNRMTNLLQLVPDNPVTDTLDAVLTVLKHIVLGAQKGLDGLASMDPQGTYLAALNGQGQQTTTRFYAVASNYEPPRGSPLLTVTRNGVTDLVFGAEANDLVVPTSGVHTVTGAAGFPVLEPLVFETGASVDHSGYWRADGFGSKLLTWLAT